MTPPEVRLAYCPGAAANRSATARGSIPPARYEAAATAALADTSADRQPCGRLPCAPGHPRARRRTHREAEDQRGNRRGEGVGRRADRHRQHARPGDLEQQRREPGQAERCGREPERQRRNDRLDAFHALLRRSLDFWLPVHRAACCLRPWRREEPLPPPTALAPTAIRTGSGNAHGGDEHESREQGARCRASRVPRVKGAGRTRRGPSASRREPPYGDRKCRAEGNRGDEDQQERHAEPHDRETTDLARRSGRPTRAPALSRAIRREDERKRRDRHFEKNVDVQTLAERQRAASRPATAAPIARPPMNAATTALAAAVVCPMWRVRSRVQLTS